MRRLKTLLVLLALVSLACSLSQTIKSSTTSSKLITTTPGIEQSGGVRFVLEVDVPGGIVIEPNQMDIVRQIMLKRAKALGVQGISIQISEERRFIIETPPIQDIESTIATLKTTGMLEFVDMSGLHDTEAQQMIGQIIVTDFTSSSPVNGTIWHTVLTGSAIQSAEPAQDQTGGWNVSFELSEQGKEIFANYTRQHIGKVLAIVLDKKVVSAPRINSAITEGKGVISSNFTRAEAQSLAILVKYGALPVPLKVIQSETISPKP